MGSANTMVSHRVKIESVEGSDAEPLGWLRDACRRA